MERRIANAPSCNRERTATPDRNTQRADGTWLVPTRHHPPTQGNPIYVDTFPHGPNQFISYAGLNRAAMSLLPVLPMVNAPQPLRESRSLELPARY